MDKGFILMPGRMFSRIPERECEGEIKENEEEENHGSFSSYLLILSEVYH